MTDPIIFATGNQAKLAQLRYVVDHDQLPFEVIAAISLAGEAARYQERGESATEIAAHGATAVAARLGRAVLTEDTTFSIAALEGRPGVTAGAFLKTDGRSGILKALEGAADRRAWITSGVAYCEPGRPPLVLGRTIPGTITGEERWTAGLPCWIAPSPTNPAGGGYNAIFCPAGERRTLAEIPAQEALSKGYREPLFQAVLQWIKSRQQESPYSSTGPRSPR